jgi:hypothetical protein
MPKQRGKERRQYSRLPVKKGIVALLNLDETPIITKLIDINRKGLAFSYTSIAKLPSDRLEIDVLIPDEERETDIYLGTIQARIIEVHDLVRRLQPNIPRVRRYCVEFYDLEEEQQTCLSDCIDHAFHLS